MGRIHCFSPEEAAERFRQGFRLCPIGSDVGFVAAAARAAIQQVSTDVPELTERDQH